jgi:hypothetical protein
MRAENFGGVDRLTDGRLQLAIVPAEGEAG